MWLAILDTCNQKVNKSRFPATNQLRLCFIRAQNSIGAAAGVSSEFRRALAFFVAIFSRFSLWPGGFANRVASADAQLEDPAFWPYELSGL